MLASKRSTRQALVYLTALLALPISLTHADHSWLEGSWIVDKRESARHSAELFPKESWEVEPFSNATLSFRDGVAVFSFNMKVHTSKYMASGEDVSELQIYLENGRLARLIGGTSGPCLRMQSQEASTSPSTGLMCFTREKD